ncbi:uncharacterized protein F5891DRAFT_1190358 [Suillus fuscotomentosus]|uniref:Uncharacterized protein n=1 Tax=Suillus fuscotomentosus TaxID=1912939 RepID=A0AAD4E355_9AGAM|nr:uncharacterized protein F5891DRAFT_1190358 [Suillus fuscotomentosus]KAG1898869.1 hypothetical protein F5891DRAFT_1190358 [Suillus fuscotomentosus]
MPPPTKRQKQAKQQYASSSRCFDNGLIKDVFEVFLDPDYVPVSDAESEADSESDFNGALKGLNARQAEFAMKKYKSHRRCGPTLMMNLGVLVD